MGECSTCKKPVPNGDTYCVRCGDLLACFQSLVRSNPAAAHDWLRDRVDFMHNYRGSVEHIEVTVSLDDPSSPGG